MVTTVQTGYSEVGKRLFNGETLNDFMDGKHGMDGAITALGTTLATAYKIIRSVSQFTIVTGAAKGAALPSAITLRNTKSQNFSMNNILGKCFDIYNDDSADDMTIFAPDASTIDGVAGATGVTLTHAKRCRFTAMAVTDAGVVTWISAQLGVVSA